LPSWIPLSFRYKNGRNRRLIGFLDESPD